MRRQRNLCGIVLTFFKKEYILKLIMVLQFNLQSPKSAAVWRLFNTLRLAYAN